MVQRKGHTVPNNPSGLFLPGHSGAQNVPWSMGVEDAVNYIPPELTAFAILLSLFASLNPSFPCAGGFSSGGMFPWRSLIPLVFLKRHPGRHDTRQASTRTVLGDWICPVPGAGGVGAALQPDGTALGCALC